MKAGVLALQGDVREHALALEAAGATPVEVRTPEQLTEVACLVLPGGESTTIGKLAVAFGFIDRLRQFGQTKAIWGTCAGAILLAKDIHRPQPLLSLMDIIIARNAFGRQVDSFIGKLDVPALAVISNDNPPFPAVFIRAPIIESVSGDAHILASLPDGRIVAARQKNLLATSFHPELTGDDRFHRYFTLMAKGKV